MRADQLHKLLNLIVPQIDTEQRHDADETLAFARQLEAVMAHTYDVKYPDVTCRQLLPANYEVPSGSKTWTYRQFDEVGEAAIVHDMANDFPNVEATGKEFPGIVVPIGDSYRYTLVDLRRAAMLKMNLDQRKGEIARRVMERKLDQLAYLGDTNTGLVGIAKHGSIGTVSGATGGWAAATADVIQADIDKALTQVNNNTKGASTPNTVALSVALYNILGTKYFTAGGFRRSVLEEIKTRNSQLRFVKSDRLSTANGSAGERIIYGEFTPENCAMIVPQEFEQLAPQAKGMALVINCHMEFGGVMVPYPKAFLYQDNA